MLAISGCLEISIDPILGNIEAFTFFSQYTWKVRRDETYPFLFSDKQMNCHLICLQCGRQLPALVPFSLWWPFFFHLLSFLAALGVHGLVLSRHSPCQNDISGKDLTDLRTESTGNWHVFRFGIRKPGCE